MSGSTLGNVYSSSVTADIVGYLGQGAGWLTQQFQNADPSVQRILAGAIGLVGGLVGGNILNSVASMAGVNMDGLAGTGLKWGLALAAMTYLSSDQSPLLRPAAERPAADPVVRQDPVLPTPQ